MRACNVSQHIWPTFEGIIFFKRILFSFSSSVAILIDLKYINKQRQNRRQRCRYFCSFGNLMMNWIAMNGERAESERAAQIAERQQ